MSRLRVKHRIRDVVVIAAAGAVVGDGREDDAIMETRFGSSENALAMTASAYATAKRRLRQMMRNLDDAIDEADAP